MSSDSDPDWLVTEEPTPPGVELRSTVVHYSDGPDRCTVHPPKGSGRDRLSTWLSADRSAFVDRDAMR